MFQGFYHYQRQLISKGSEKDRLVLYKENIPYLLVSILSITIVVSLTASLLGGYTGQTYVLATLATGYYIYLIYLCTVLYYVYMVLNHYVRMTLLCIRICLYTSTLECGLYEYICLLHYHAVVYKWLTHTLLTHAVYLLYIIYIGGKTFAWWINQYPILKDKPFIQVPITYIYTYVLFTTMYYILYTIYYYIRSIFYNIVYVFKCICVYV